MADAENESELTQVPVEKEYIGMCQHYVLQRDRVMRKHESWFGGAGLLLHDCPLICIKCAAFSAVKLLNAY
jgi:hypothetical protein